MFVWLAGASAAITLMAGITPAHSSPSVVTAVGPLSDLSTGANATDGARAQVRAICVGALPDPG